LKPHKVTPHAGVWIETPFVEIKPIKKPKSRLMQACGLKRSISFLFVPVNGVTPHAGVWIET